MASPIDFGILLGLSYQAFVDELRAELAAQGFDDLGSAYGYVFRALLGEAMQQSLLASLLGISNQGASKLVDEMQRRGYVTREPDPDDGRASKIRLSARGAAALRAARRFHATYERRVAKRLGSRRAQALRSALEALVAPPDTASPPIRLRIP